MNLSPISMAVVLSCAAHIGAFAVFANTKHPPVSTNKIVFSSALQARLIQETEVAGEPIKPSITAIEAVENKQITATSKGKKSLQDQIDALQKRLAAEHTQQLALRNKLDSVTTRNIRLQEDQQSLLDQLASQQSINQLQTQKIGTLQDQTALAVQHSKELLQQNETLLQEQHIAEDTISELQTKTTDTKFQHAQASSLLKIREDQLARTHQRVKSLQQTNSELAEQTLALTTKLSNFEVIHDALSNRNSNLRHNLETVTRKNNTLSTEQETLTERYLKLNKALDQAQISEISVSMQLQQSDKMINTLTARIGHMQSEQVTLKNNLDRLGQLNRHLENKLVAKNLAISTAQNNHRLQLEQISSQQAKMRREMNAPVVEQNHQLKITTKTLQTSLKAATWGNGSLANNRAELRPKIQILNRRLTELRASHKELASVNIDQHSQTETPLSDLQIASVLPTQQASLSTPNTGNSKIDFKAKQVAGNPKPVYPWRAYKLGLEGRVLMDISMSAEGAVEKVRIRDSSGSPMLDTAAIRAVKKWRFYPVLRDGKAIPFTDTGHIIFKIKDS